MNAPPSEASASISIPGISRELDNIHIESAEAATTLDCNSQCEYSDDAAQSELIEMTESLYSCSLSQLLVEPSRIKGLRNQLMQQRQASAIANCASLIETSECLTDLHKQVIRTFETTESPLFSLSLSIFASYSDEVHLKRSFKFTSPGIFS